MIGGIRYEQAVYGSFPFWGRGYGVLARSALCRREWVEALCQAGQRFGDRPAGVEDRDCLFAIRLARGTRMIVGVSAQGNDDQGRPGALAFHGLFVGRWAYRRAGYDPFRFLPALRRDWTLEDLDRGLPGGRLVEPAPGEEAVDPGSEGLVDTIAAALRRRRRVVLSSGVPIDGLARAVWRRLPGRTRRETTVATWAFSNDNQFDLVAVPRLARLALDGSELIVNGSSSGVGIRAGNSE